MEGGREQKSKTEWPPGPPGNNMTRPMANGDPNTTSPGMFTRRSIRGYMTIEISQWRLHIEHLFRITNSTFCHIANWITNSDFGLLLHSVGWEYLILTRVTRQTRELECSWNLHWLFSIQFVCLQWEGRIPLKSLQIDKIEVLRGLCLTDPHRPLLRSSLHQISEIQ